jgi:hypothetical protein
VSEGEVFPSEAFWHALPEDRPPGTAYRCPGCGGWRWAVALSRPITEAERACPHGRAGCPHCARLTLVVVFAHRCPDCGHEWTHRARF